MKPRAMAPRRKDSLSVLVGGVVGVMIVVFFSLLVLTLSGVLSTSPIALWFLSDSSIQSTGPPNAFLPIDQDSVGNPRVSAVLASSAPASVWGFVSHNDRSVSLGGLVYTVDRALALLLLGQGPMNASCPTTAAPFKIVWSPSCPSYRIGMGTDEPERTLDVVGQVRASDGFEGPADDLTCGALGVCTYLTILNNTDTAILANIVAIDVELLGIQATLIIQQSEIDLILSIVGNGTAEFNNTQCPTTTFCGLQFQLNNETANRISNDTDIRNSIAALSVNFTTAEIHTDLIKSATAGADLVLTSSGNFVPNHVIITTAGSVTIPPAQTLTTSAITSAAPNSLTLTGATSAVVIGIGNQLQADSITNGPGSNDLGLSADGNVVCSADFIANGFNIFANAGGFVDSSGGIKTDTIVSHTAATDITITPTGSNLVLPAGKTLKTNAITSNAASALTLTGATTVVLIGVGNSLAVDTITNGEGSSDLTLSPSGNVVSTKDLHMSGTNIILSGLGFVDSAGGIKSDTYTSHTALTDISITPTGNNVVITAGKILETDTIHTTTLNGDLTLTTTGSGTFKPNNVIITSAGTLTIPAGQFLHTDSIASTTGAATVVSASPFKVSDTTDSSGPGTGSLETLGGLGVTKAGFFGGNVNSAGSVAADTYTSHTAATDITITPTGTNVVISTGKILVAPTLKTDLINPDATANVQITSATGAVGLSAGKGITITSGVTDLASPINMNNVLVSVGGSITIAAGQALLTETVNARTAGGNLAITTTAISTITVTSGSGGINLNGVTVSSVGSLAIPTGQALLTETINARTAGGNLAITTTATSTITVTSGSGGINLNGVTVSSAGVITLPSTTALKTDLIQSATAATNLVLTSTGNFVPNNVIITTGGSITVPSGQTLSANTLQTTTTNGNLAITTTSTGNINANGVLFSSAGSVTVPTGQALLTETINARTAGGNLAITTTATSTITITSGSGGVNINGAITSSAGSVSIPAGQSLTTNTVTSRAATALTLSGANTQVVIATGDQLLVDSITNQATTDVTITADGVITLGADTHAAGTSIFLDSGGSLVFSTGTSPSLNTWDVTSLAVTMDGPCGTPGPAVTIGIRKLGGPGGSMVEIAIPTFTCTKTTTTAFVSSLNLAAAYQPAATVGAIMPVEEGTSISTAPGMATITNTGQIFVWASMGSGSFTAAGTCGMPQYRLTIAYMK